MAYIGKTPTVGNFVKLDALTASTTASYTMQLDSVNFSPESVNHMLVSLNGVIQAPTDSYTISGSTITFASALTASDSIDFIMVYGNVLDIGTPSDATISTAKIIDGAVTNAKLANSSITLNGSAVSLGGSATVGGDNTPYFHVTKSADQTISSDSFTTVTFDSEIFDSGNNFASNTFTAPSTGYYFIYSQLVWSGTTNSDYSLNRLMKNGSPVNWVAFFQTNSSGAFGGRVILLSANDTVTVQCYQDSGVNLSLRGGSEDECQFGGFKLIT